MRILTVTRDHPLRRKAAFFIRQAYFQHYHARIRLLPEKLIALAGSDDSLHCIAGLRESAEGFFPEHYLDTPIERIAGEIAGRHVERGEIVEVTSFASRSPACSAMFIGKLVRYGQDLGFNFALFTVTARLGVLLRRLGLPMTELAMADAKRIPEADDEWGAYYEDSPKVYLIERGSLASFTAGRGHGGQPCGARANA